MESEAAMALGIEATDWADYDVVLGAGVGEFADCGEIPCGKPVVSFSLHDDSDGEGVKALRGSLPS